MALEGSSQELQEITLIGLLNDPYMLARCSSEITESYFSTKEYKLIYKSLIFYYNKYLKIPTENELVLVMQDFYREEYGSLDSAKEILNKLNQSEVPDEDFVYERVISFIRRVRVEKTLGKTVDAINSNSVNLDEIATELKDSLSISLNKSSLYRLSDIEKIDEVKEEAIGSSDNPVMIKFFLDPVNWCMQYKAMIPGTVNMVVAPPGRGKTTLAINQGISAAKQGYNSLHVFLGDMKRYDGLLRYLSCYSGIDTSKLVDLSNENLTKLVKKYNMSGVFGNIYILSYGADEISPSQLTEEIKSLQRDNKVHFHQIIIDYDENFATDIDSMYEKGGAVYNRLALFSVLNKSVLFVLCQPKPQYWNNEIIPLEGAAESSKKQKIIDLMLTIGSKDKSSSVGTLNIAKNRRGSDGKYVRIRKYGSNAQIVAISEAEYIEILNKEKYENKSSDE